MPHQGHCAPLLESRARLLALVEQIDNPRILDAMFTLGFYACHGEVPRQTPLVRVVLVGMVVGLWQWLA